MTSDEVLALEELSANVAEATAAGREGNFTYLTASKHADASAVLRRGAELSGVLGVLDSPPSLLYDGFHAWKKELVLLGVDGNRVVAVPLIWEIQDEWTETDSLVRFLRTVGDTFVGTEIPRKINIVAPAHRLLPTYAAVVSAIKRGAIDALAWPVPAKELPWDERAPVPRHHLAVAGALGIVEQRMRGSTTYALPSTCLDHMAIARGT